MSMSKLCKLQIVQVYEYRLEHEQNSRMWLPLSLFLAKDARAIYSTEILQISVFYIVVILSYYESDSLRLV